MKIEIHNSVITSVAFAAVAYTLSAVYFSVWCCERERKTHFPHNIYFLWHSSVQYTLQIEEKTERAQR